MPVFPKIQSACPYKGVLADIMQGDICRLCHREVVDLTPLTDAGRVAFLAACKTEVCVSYRLRPAIAAAVAAAALSVASAAPAQDAEMEIILVGAILEPAQVEYVSTADDAAPELEVNYEDVLSQEDPQSRLDADAPPQPSSPEGRKRTKTKPVSVQLAALRIQIGLSDAGWRRGGPMPSLPTSIGGSHRGASAPSRR